MADGLHRKMNKCCIMLKNDMLAIQSQHLARNKVSQDWVGFTMAGPDIFKGLFDKIAPLISTVPDLKAELETNCVGILGILPINVSTIYFDSRTYHNHAPGSMPHGYETINIDSPDRVHGDYYEDDGDSRDIMMIDQCKDHDDSGGQSLFLARTRYSEGMWQCLPRTGVFRTLLSRH